MARGLDVLACFKAQPTLSLAEITARTALARPVAQRLVNTLVDAGYLMRAPSSRRYQVALECIYLSTSARRAMEPRIHALPLMIDIARDTGETVNLNLLDRRNWMALCVESVDGAEKARYNMNLGSPGHLHAGASRKVILAYLSDADRAAALARHGIPRVGPNTVRDEATLLDQLAEIREQGWAVTMAESQAGEVIGCAVPILMRTGDRVIGSLSVIGPASRLDADKQRHVVELLLQAAAAVPDSITADPAHLATADGHVHQQGS